MAFAFPPRNRNQAVPKCVNCFRAQVTVGFCSRCLMVGYCGSACQEAYEPFHQKVCNDAQKLKELRQSRQEKRKLEPDQHAQVMGHCLDLAMIPSAGAVSVAFITVNWVIEQGRDEEGINGNGMMDEWGIAACTAVRCGLDMLVHSLIGWLKGEARRPGQEEIIWRPGCIDVEKRSDVLLLTTLVLTKVRVMLDLNRIWNLTLAEIDLPANRADLARVGGPFITSIWSRPAEIPSKIRLIWVIRELKAEIAHLWKYAESFEPDIWHVTVSNAKKDFKDRKPLEVEADSSEGVLCNILYAHMCHAWKANPLALEYIEHILAHPEQVESPGLRRRLRSIEDPLMKWLCLGWPLDPDKNEDVGWWKGG